VLLSRHPGHVYLGHRMVNSAANLDYEPAVLSLVAHLFRQRQYPDPKLEKLRAKFRRIVDQGRNPNALALHGMILHIAVRNEVDAVAAFRRALEVGIENNTRVAGFKWTAAADFEWAADCYYLLGKILAKRHGQKKEAMSLLEKAALELDFPEAYYELAMLLDKDGPDGRWVQYMIKAAANGVPNAATELGVWFGRPQEPATGYLSKFLSLRRVQASAEWHRVSSPGVAL